MSREKRELFFNQLMPFGNHGLWGALTLLLIARGVTLTVLAPKYLFRSGSVLKNEVMETRIGTENENFIVTILASGSVTLAKPSGGVGLAPFGEHYIFFAFIMNFEIGVCSDRLKTLSRRGFIACLENESFFEVTMKFMKLLFC